MTFHQWTVNYCVERGMFSEQAEEVFVSMSAAKENEAMRQRWEDDVEHYPPSMQAVLTLTISRHAVIWIDVNIPLAWFRPLFAKTNPEMEADQLIVV